MNDSEKIEKINEIIIQYGQFDGGHHKAWCLDQVMRITKGDKYESFVDWYENTDDNGKRCEEKEYSWDAGIAP